VTAIPPRRGALRALRHTAEYAALGVARELFRQLPPDASVALGAALGAAYARLRGPRTRDAATNLRLAFPEASEGERRRLLVATFANLGRSIAEVFLLQGRHRDRLVSGLSIEGLEQVDVAKQRSESGGLIVLTAHFGSWELCGAAMAQRGYPLSVVHHEIANPRLERMVGDWRRAAGVEEIALGRAATGVFRALARGRFVCLLLDQNAHRDEGVFAPFFGELALTRSGPATLAMERGVPVLPVFVFRNGTGSRHTVRVFPPLDLEPGGPDREGALERNVARMNAAIERAIRMAPDHWLWPHRRFKTRPAGALPIYPRRRFGLGS
jgi:KDO2-lipid IV(A) lauroyltransferase